VLSIYHGEAFKALHIQEERKVLMTVVGNLDLELNFLGGFYYLTDSASPSDWVELTDHVD